MGLYLPLKFLMSKGRNVQVSDTTGDAKPFAAG